MYVCVYVCSGVYSPHPMYNKACVCMYRTYAHDRVHVARHLATDLRLCLIVYTCTLHFWLLNFHGRTVHHSTSMYIHESSLILVRLVQLMPNLAGGGGERSYCLLRQTRVNLAKPCTCNHGNDYRIVYSHES